MTFMYNVHIFVIRAARDEGGTRIAAAPHDLCE